MSDYFINDFLNVPIINKDLPKPSRNLVHQNSISLEKNNLKFKPAVNDDERSESPTRKSINNMEFESNKLKHKYEILKLKPVENIQTNSMKADSELKRKVIWNKEGPSIEVR